MNMQERPLVVVAAAILLAAIVASLLPAQPAFASEAASPLGGEAPGGGPIGITFRISDSSALEVQPAVAYNPDRQEYLVVWYTESGYPEIRGRRISKSGTPLGAWFTIDGAEFRELRFPDVAYSPHHKEYLVVWEEFTYGPPPGTIIRGRRLGGTGGPVTQSFNIYQFDPSHAPAVAYASTSHKFLIVWEWFDMVGNSIMGRTFEPGVGLGDTRYIHEDTGGTAAFQPDVAYCRTRNEHLVVWRQDNPDPDIHGRRVRGQTGEPLAVPLHISTLGHPEQRPAVAALPLVHNRGNYLVAWELDIGTSMNIMARSVEIASDGTPSMTGHRFLAVSDEDETMPAAAGSENRKEYLVTWRQAVSYGDGPIVVVFDSVVGRALEPNGALLGDGFGPIGGIGAGWSAADAGPGGDYLVAFDDEFAGDINILGRLWGSRVYLPTVMR